MNIGDTPKSEMGFTNDFTQEQGVEYKEIPRFLNDLEHKLMGLEKSTHMLIEKIQSVVEEDYPKSESNEGVPEPKVSCELGSKLFTLSETVEAINTRVLNTMERVQL